MRQSGYRFSSVVLTTSQIRLACGGILFLSASIALAQAPEGPMAPRPNTQIQQTPPAVLSKLTARVTLVTTPVTVRDSRGAVIHDLDQQDFLVTDNGVAQKIIHFEVGGDPLSIVIVVETSTRVDSIVPQLRKLGILFTQQVMGPEAEAAVIGFDDSLHRLQGFTRNHDSVESVFAGLKTTDSGHRLFDAMAEGVALLSDRRKPTAENPAPGRRILLVLSEALDSGAKPSSARSFARPSFRTSPFSASAFRPSAANCSLSRATTLPFPLPLPAFPRFLVPLAPSTFPPPEAQGAAALT